MIVIVAYIILLLIFSKKEPSILLPSLISSAVLLFFHSLFFIEFQNGGIDYFISDERVYMNIDGSNSLSSGAIKDRWLWFFLVKIVENSDFTGGLFNKLISLPLIPVFLYVIFKITKSNMSLYLLLLLPYILYIMQTSLRDSLILFLVILFAYFSFSQKRTYLIFGGIILLLIFYLRPFYIPLVLISFFIVKFFVEVNGLNLKNSFFKFVKYLFIVTTISLVIYFTFQSKFDQYLRNILYYYEFGLSIDEDLLPVKSTFSFSYVIYSVVRFVFTPIPTSLIDRLLTGNVTQFGYVDDVVRLVNQTILYLMILYIILKPKYLYVYFKSLINNSKELFLLIFIFTNTLVYSVYYAGGGHSRLKIPIFLGVFLIFNGVVKYNAKKEN